MQAATPAVKDLYGIIGYPLGHSRSPVYFNEKFAAAGMDAHYQAFPLASIAALPSVLQQHPNLRGFNVTIPYKQQVMPLLTAIDPGAAAVGAVNCVVVHNGALKGYNTDVTGFARSLKPLLQPQHNRALVLGSGGASKAAGYVLQQSGIPFQIVSRTGGNGQLRYEDIDAAIIDAHKLIINTTPLGMSPDITSAPAIPYHLLSTAHLLYDLVYNPERTEFLRRGEERGAQIKNGAEMWLLQAEASWALWNGAQRLEG